MKVTLIILVALAAAVICRKRSAAVRHWVLAVGIVCAGLMPLMAMVFPEWQPPLGGRLMAGSNAPFIQPSVTTDVEISMQSKPVVTNASPGVSREGVLRAIWLIGTMCGLLVLTAGLGRLAVLASQARRVSDPRWNAMLGSVQLLQSSHPTLLVTWGLFRPTIVLPVSAREWSEERTRIVLWHELAHIRRHDWFVQMLAELLRAVYWFNPLVWIACRRLRQESEQACDDEVLGCGVVGTEYATELLGLARDLRHPRRSWFPGFPAPAMARPSSLGRRVSAMLNTRTNRTPISISIRVATAAALLAIAIPLAAAQAFATLSGTLVDATGGALPDARVVLSNTQRQSKYEVRSGPGGTFEFVGLPAGTYELDVQQMGFASFHEALSIAPGQNVQRRLTLRIGSLQETITVAVSDSDPAPDPASKGAGITQKAAFQPVDLTGCAVSTVGGNIRVPKKLRDMHPEYPATLRGTGIDGVVVLEAVIGVDGYLKNIEVRDAANPDLANAAVAAVREWQFTQTILNCTPVEPSMTITTRFTHKAGQ